MPQDSRLEAGDDVHDDGRRQLAPAEDEVADGELFIGHKLGDALIHAFIAATDEHQPLVTGKAAGGGLIKAPALSRQQNHRIRGAVGAGGITQQVIQTGGDGLRFHDHAFAAPEGPVVGRAVHVGGVGAKVMDGNGDGAGAGGAGNHAELQRAVEELGKNGEEVETHARMAF